MKSYGLAAAGFVAGVVASVIFYSIQSTSPPQQNSSDPPPKIGESAQVPQKECEICKCGPSNAMLPPPKFSEKLPAILETNHMAEVRVAWHGVEGAKGYSVFLTNAKGKLLKKYSTSRTVIFLKEVPIPKDPPEDLQYSVFLATVNGNDEDGAKSEGRALKVNKLAAIVAPTVKKIIIED